jgi:Mg-chelatase subunit ChlD
VRGAIDLVAVAGRLADHAGTPLQAGSRAGDALILRAALLALSGRVQAVAGGRPAEAVLTELFEDVFLLAPARAAPGRHALDVDNPVQARAESPEKLRTVKVRELAAPDVPDAQAWPKAGAPKAAPRVLAAADVDALLAPAPGPALAADDAPGEESQDALAALGGTGSGDAESEDGEDPEALRERARRLARELLLRLPRRTPTRAAGRGKLTSIRYRFNSDDLDLDRTLEEIAGNPFPEAQDFWVYERVRTRRAYALMLDVSGSMRGEQLVHAAVAAGALATAIERDDLAVVAFWRDAAVLEALSAQVDAERLLTRVLALSARGLTNLHLGLELGLRELSRSSAQERVGILFSDCGHNLGDDPLALARRFDVLHVVGTSDAPARVRACHDVAARGGGRCVFATTLEEIPAAINACVGE